MNKIPWQEHAKGQAERRAVAPGSRYEIGVASSGSTWCIIRVGPNRLLEREQLAHTCVQQQYSALGGSRMPLGSEALSWLVSCFLTLLIPHFSPQMFSVSWPVAGGGGRTEMALLSWCGRDFSVE